MRRERGREWGYKIDQLIVVFIYISGGDDGGRGGKCSIGIWKVDAVGRQEKEKNEKLTVSRAGVGAQSVGRRQGQSKSNKF